MGSKPPKFHKLGLSINEGVAVDARLVKSASRPVSKSRLEQIRTNALTHEGKLDKNGNVKKFCRDLESDWTIKNNKPHYEIKEHAAFDTKNDFILSTYLSPASHDDLPYLPRAVIYSMHSDQASNAPPTIQYFSAYKDLVISLLPFF